MPSCIRPTRHAVSLCGLLLLALAFLHAQTQPTVATTVPLILPGGLAYDAAGDLYFAETGNHVVRRVSAGVLTTVAGTGTQGFAGDGGPATAALLDSPSAVALDPAGDLFVADAHNHRIRRVDAVSGIITTVAGDGTTAQLDLPSALAIDAAGDIFFADARRHVVRRIDHATGAITTVGGNGTQGFAGDGGPAVAAEIDSPTGLALDAAGDLFIADTHNHRVRRVDALTHTISSVAGTGQPGFAGDAGAATAATLDLPRGLAVDAGGNLFVVDSRNQRIRRIDALSGQITTIAGQGTQAYLGDGGPAASASIDSPRAVTIAPTGLPTIADTGNQRVRQVDAQADIHTIAGLGGGAASALTLTGPAVTLYGTGSVTSQLIASAATGSVTFFDAGTTLASVPLTANTAVLATSALAAGVHRLSATYAGDAAHASAASQTISLTISPAPAQAAAVPVAMLYGQPVPALTGTLTGILAQDAGAVTLALTSTATSLSPPGTYPITATLSGAAAANYLLTQPAAQVTITQARSPAALTSSLAVQVSTTTSGQPSGTVQLLDAGAPVATATLSNSGTAQFSTTGLTTGSHTLTAAYQGDRNFLPTSSNAEIITVGASASPDFTLTAISSSPITVTAGNSAIFAFTGTPLNGALSSPILLTVSGLPGGATGTFNPAYLPPSAAATPFTLTITTAKVARLERSGWLVVAMLLPLLLVRRRRGTLLAGLLTALLLVAGCGNRVNSVSVSSASATYNVVITGTATAASGATLQHSLTVVLTVQP